MSIILFSLLVSMGINIIMFLPAFRYKTDKLTDISYAVTFLVVGFANYLKSTKTTFHALLLALMVAWAARLGTFLFIRITAMKKDARFDGMRDNFWLFLRFWLLQGLTVFVVSISATLAFGYDAPRIGWLAWTGVFVFVVGLLLEAIADAQKFRFNARNTKGEWIDTGIWRISRHPNYLGEMLVWTGIYIVAFGVLIGVDRLWALASPLYIYSLLLFVSGIPLLEKSGDKKWGNKKEYQAYKKSVPVLLPTLSSIRRIRQG